MCTISHQKCVCFVFLVVLAVLSCSGFRIDNLAMTDVSKRNSGVPELSGGGAHRLRHRRNVTSLNTRHRTQCTEVDPSWKAYRSSVVAVASVESSRVNCTGNCQMKFRVHEWVKNLNGSNYEFIRVNYTFSTTRKNYCEKENPKKKMPPLVKRRLLNKMHILYLVAKTPHEYVATYAPTPYKNKTLSLVRRASNETEFIPVKVTLISKKAEPKRIKLVCKLIGFPIPVITWKVNNKIIQQNNRIKIKQKRKKSTLEITHVMQEDWGEYECIANGIRASKIIAKPKRTSMPKPKTTPKPTTPRPTQRLGISSSVSDSDRIECGEKMKDVWCYNGGTCFYTPDIKEHSCVCPQDFEGPQCEKKTSQQFSRYPQPAISTCKAGLYTNYNKC